MAEITKITPAVARKLGYYVYVYIRPDTEQVFYVGKGKGNRALAHIDGSGDTPHDEVIRELNRRGLEPRVEILIHGLATEAEAFAVEMAAIDLIGLERLANRVHGHHRARRGRMTLEQIQALYGSKDVHIKEPAILIRIARAFHYGISPVELYDITRAAWVVGARREGVEYALAVFEGVVREVYRVTGWLPAGSTFRVDYPEGHERDGRHEFVGVVAEDAVRRKYLNHSVGHYFTEHSQNPILYVNC
ncbi:MAG: LEM-3-like GIY-YIG domain-containing protein [Phycisphaerales bacterium JB063]